MIKVDIKNDKLLDVTRLCVGLLTRENKEMEQVGLSLKDSESSDRTPRIVVLWWRELTSAEVAPG